MPLDPYDEADFRRELRARPSVNCPTVITVKSTDDQKEKPDADSQPNNASTVESA